MNLFIGEEEECLVLPDGPAYRSSELIAAQRGDSSGSKFLGGCLFGAVKPEGRTVNIIGPGLGGNLHHGSSGSSKLSRGDAGRRFEFGDVFDRRDDDQGVDHRVVVVEAIEQVVVGLRAQTIDSKRRAARFVVAPGLGRRTPRPDAGCVIPIKTPADTRSEQSQLGEVAAVERELHYLPSLGSPRRRSK